MTDEPNLHSEQPAGPREPSAGPREPSAAPESAPQTQRPALFELPALFAIGAYMILLAVMIVVYVVQGRVGPLFLVFSVLFIAAGLGLMMLLRWAWALTLAATVLSAAWCLWSFSLQHNPASLVQGSLNLVFFLYLVRTGVRAKLR